MRLFGIGKTEEHELDKELLVTKTFKILGLMSLLGGLDALYRNDEGLLEDVCISNVNVAEDVTQIVGSYVQFEVIIETNKQYSTARIIANI